MPRLNDRYPKGYPTIKGRKFAFDFFGARAGQVDFRDWTTGIAGFQIVNRKLKNTGAGTALIISKLVKGKDFNIQMKAGSGSEYMGVLFGAQDYLNWYMVRINGSTRAIELFKSVAGTLTNLGSVTLGASGRVDNILEVSWVGSKIIARTAGGQLVATDTTFTDGYLGLRSASTGKDTLEWIKGEWY